MAVPFGFSIGDFISGIILVKDIVQALSDNRGSSKEYLDLKVLLQSLALALNQIQGQFGDIQEDLHRAALVSAVTACREVVNDFLPGIEKYKESLCDDGPKSLWKDTLRKIKWKLSMPEELATFRGKISFHANAIGLLLHTVQYAAMVSHHKAQGDHYEIHTGKLHAVLTTLQALDRKLDLVGQARTRNDSSHGQMIKDLEGTKSFMVQQYQLLAQIYTPLPAQVLFSAPVVFRDANNRMAPFNLQFIDCWESFFSVIENRFRDGGAKKVARREFLLENGQSGRPIRLDQPWSVSFSPGDRVDMAMIFRSVKLANEIVGPTCKKCETRTVDTKEECESCGSSFRRILDVTDDSNTSEMKNASSSSEPPQEHRRSQKRKRAFLDPGEGNPGESDSDNRPEKYKRVQVHCKPPVSRGPLGMLRYRCEKPGCNGAFPTRYLLEYHVSKHSSSPSNPPNPSQFYPVDGGRRALEGEGSERKREMASHDSINPRQRYICPFCPDQNRCYPRPDNLVRHVRAHHTDKERDDPQLRAILTQPPAVRGGARDEQRRATFNKGEQGGSSELQQGQLLSTTRPTALAVNAPQGERRQYTGTGNAADVYDSDEQVQPAKNDLEPPLTPPPFIPDTFSSVEEESDCPTPSSTESIMTFYGIPLLEKLDHKTKSRRWRRLKRRKRRRRREKFKRMKTRTLQRKSQGDSVLLRYLDPNNQEIAQRDCQTAMDPAPHSQAEHPKDEKNNDIDMQRALLAEHGVSNPQSEAVVATETPAAVEAVDDKNSDIEMGDALSGENS